MERPGLLNAIPQTPRIVTELPGPKSREVVAAEARHLAPGVQSIATLSGLAVARAEGSVVEDVDGNRFLDLAAGVCVNAVGHAHPRYGQILKDQIDEVTVGPPATLRPASTASSSTPAARRRWRRPCGSPNRTPGSSSSCPSGAGFTARP